MSDPPGQSVVQSLFDAALEEFEKQTGTSLARHPLAKKLETCHSIESITDALTEQAQEFRRFRGDERKGDGVPRRCGPACCILFAPMESLATVSVWCVYIADKICSL
jgi:hypothetical protein